MRAAPYGVFALLGSLIVDVAGEKMDDTLDLFAALGLYALNRYLGLLILVVFI